LTVDFEPGDVVPTLALVVGFEPVALAVVFEPNVVPALVAAFDPDVVAALVLLLEPAAHL
jgi:hypothetical protein